LSGKFCPHLKFARKEEVDEIRHEDKEDEFYLDFIKEDK
jgi:hypothetical protein